MQLGSYSLTTVSISPRSTCFQISLAFSWLIFHILLSLMIKIPAQGNLVTHPNTLCSHQHDQRVLQNSSLVTRFLYYYLSSYYTKLNLPFEALHKFCPKRAQVITCALSYLFCLLHSQHSSKKLQLHRYRQSRIWPAETLPVSNVAGRNQKDRGAIPT